MKNIQFSHANGFPAESYNCLFKNINGATINYVPEFGMGSYQVKNDWRPLIDELIDNIQQNFNEPIVGLGHSLGGVLTYFAAQQRPDLFSQIIVLDPPFFRPLKRGLIDLMVRTNTLHKFPHPANKSKNRRFEFDSKKEAFDYFKGKGLFKVTKEECLQNYVDAGLRSNNGKYELSISRELEYKIFITMPLFLTTRALKMPSTFIYSNRFEAMERKDFNWVKKAMPFFSFIEMDGSHLFPFEKPTELANIINSII